MAREFPCSDFPPPPPAPPGFSLRGEVPEVAGLDEAKIPHPRPEKNPTQTKPKTLHLSPWAGAAGAFLR